MKSVTLVDANVILRFLLGDHPQLSHKAKDIFHEAEEGKRTIYLDEVVVAEVIWVLQSFYKVKRIDIATKMEQLVGQDWMMNPRKPLILGALARYHASTLDYIDCWLLEVIQESKSSFMTFDAKLAKQIKT